MMFGAVKSPVIVVGPWSVIDPPVVVHNNIVSLELIVIPRVEFEPTPPFFVPLENEMVAPDASVNRMVPVHVKF